MKNDLNGKDSVLHFLTVFSAISADYNNVIWIVKFTWYIFVIHEEFHIEILFKSVERVIAAIWVWTESTLFYK